MKPTIKKPLAAKKVPEDNLYFSKPKDHLKFISSGCSTLDCVLGGGWVLGRVSNVVGDKSTGKTLLAIEALVNFFRSYPKGVAKYNETEAAFDDEYANALGLDIRKVQRASSSTVEELFDDLTAFVDGLQGKPGLYIVDSLDALSDKAEMDRGIAEGSYGASKPKQMGQLFRRLVRRLEESEVCVIIISQVRDAIGVTFGNKYTRSGGHALDFYATHILWLAHKGQIKKTVSKIQRTVGVSIKAKTSKNKAGQPFRECDFDILFGYGVDDISSGLEFLKEAGRMDALGLGSGKDDALVTAFRKAFGAAPVSEQAEMREALTAAVRDVWYEIERTFLPPKGKYA